MAKVSWMWGGKGIMVLIRETKTHKFARTANGELKRLRSNGKDHDYAGNPNWPGDD